MTTQTIHVSRKLRFILDGGPVDAKAMTVMKEKQWQRSLRRRARTDYAGCFYLWSRAGSPQSDAMRDALFSPRNLARTLHDHANRSRLAKTPVHP